MPISRTTTTNNKKTMTIAKEHAKAARQLQNDVEAFLKRQQVQKVKIGETGFAELKPKQTRH